MYHVRLEQFEGPFPLLLSLIEREQLDLTRLSLSRVADQYLEHIAARDVSIEHLSEFLSVAARLLLLKSRALLPIFSLTDEEEESIEDLEARLIEYRRYAEAAQKIGRMFASSSRGFHRVAESSIQGVFVMPRGVSPESLAAVFRRVLDAVPVSVLLEERSVEEVMTIEERIAVLEERMVRRISTAFSEIVAESKDRSEIIVSFLALLELVRRRNAEVHQDCIFGEIVFRRVSLDRMTHEVERDECS